MEETPTAIGPRLDAISGLDWSTMLSVVFAFVFLWWLIYTLIVIYHWLRHAQDSWIAVPAVAVHLIVSGLLIFYATSGLH